MKTQAARDLGEKIAALVSNNQIASAYVLLAPILAECTPFPVLESIGKPVGVCSCVKVKPFLDRIAAAKTEGGWVVIAKVLSEQLDCDYEAAFEYSKNLIIAADVWYAADIFGERVPGVALVNNFSEALNLLSPWRQDANRWVRRSLGVAIHFWTKRSLGNPEKHSAVEQLLTFIEPLFEEQDQDAIKGLGWGLKTIGKYYPELLTEWMARQLKQQRHPRALMLRKALTYFSGQQRAYVMKGRAVK